MSAAAAATDDANERRVEFRVLGPIEVRTDGLPVDILEDGDGLGRW